MAGTIAGSVEEVSIDGRIFPVAGDADVTLQLGGFENEVAPNGDGSVRYIQKRVQWKLSSVNLSINHDRADLEFLQDKSDSPGESSITITLRPGKTYQGTGKLVGEIGASSQSTTASIGFEGGGKLEQQ